MFAKFTRSLLPAWSPAGGQYVALACRYIGLVGLSLAMGTSSLTFHWVIEHRIESNLFPEFAGRVVYLSDLFLVGGLVIWAVGWYASPRRAINVGPRYLFLPLLILTILGLLSAGWAIDGSQTAFAALRRVGLLALYLALVNESTRAVVPVATVLVAIGFLHTAAALSQVVEGSAAGLSLLGELSEGALGYAFVGAPRAYGLGFNPNPVGLFLAVTAACCYGVYILGRSDWQARGLALIAFVITTIGLSVTGSRAPFWGLVLAVLVVTLLGLVGGRMDFSRVAARAAIGLILVLGFGVLVHTFVRADASVDQRTNAGEATSSTSRGTAAQSAVERTATSFTPESVSGGLGTRFDDWRLSGPVLRENLLKGVGAGGHPLALKDKVSPNTVGGIWTPIHNVLLTVTAEHGMFGGALWAVVMVAPLVWILARLRSPAGNIYQKVWLAPLIVLLCVGLGEFTPWATQDGRLLMWGVLGLWAGEITSVPSLEPRALHTIVEENDAH